MGDPSVEVTEESRDAAQMSKAKAINVISEGRLQVFVLVVIPVVSPLYLLILTPLSISGKLEVAIEHLTEAIMLNPGSAILYATRGKLYVMIKFI